MLSLSLLFYFFPVGHLVLSFLPHEASLCDNTLVNLSLADTTLIFQSPSHSFLAFSLIFVATNAIDTHIYERLTIRTTKISTC
jgi:hypothetical protein